MTARTAWQIQKTVFYALFIREAQTRFGRFRLGYFWAFIEPLSHIIILSLLFSIIRDRSAFFDVPFPVFFATGILSFFLFQKTVLNSLGSVRANQNLFGYRQVKPIDSIFVRAFLEIVVTLFCLIVLALVGSWIFDYQIIPAKPIRFFVVITLIAFLGLGVGVMVAVLAAISEEMGKFVPTIIRPLYFLSGIFYPLEAVPEKYHSYLLWNPMLHGVEQFRLSFIKGYPSESTSIYYLFICALASVFIGLVIYFINYERVMRR